MGRKKGDTYIHKWNTGVRERKKKKTFVREEAGMSFTLSFSLPTAQKSSIELATFNTTRAVSNLHTVHN